MRRYLTGAFLLIGASLTILQALLVRELLVSFSGNELSIGFVLGAWLLLEALGSGLVGRLSRHIPPRPASYAWFQVTLAFLLLPTFLLAVYVRFLVGAVPGEAIAPLPALGGSLLALAPLGLVAGAMFATACRVLEWSGTASTTSPGRVYVLEAAGSIAGGIALTYLLIPLLSSAQTFLLVAALNLAAAAGLFWVSSPRRILAGLGAGLLGIAALVALVPPFGPALHQRIVAGRWAPAQLVYEGNSDYGNVAAIAVQGQVTVFANGAPVLTTPNPDAATVEQLVHLPALFLDGLPRRVLVIGGGAGGVLAEVERYPLLERVDYVEMDPLVIRAAQALTTSLTAAELADRRVHLALEDGRRFVLRTSSAGTLPYDLILVNLPPPSTLVLNRLYTREFLAVARLLLAPQGVLAVTAPPARTYMAPAARDLLACYERTLTAIFPHVRAILADEQTLWLASPAQPLDLEATELARRWEARGLPALVLREEYFRYLLDGTVAAEFAAGLAEGPPVELNQDGHPAGLRYTLAYESARFSPGLELFYRALGQLRWWHAALGIGLLTVAGLFLARRRETVVPLATFSTGLAGMTACLLVLLSFQVLYGYVYRQVGLLVTAFMAGLSLGGLLMTVWARRLLRPWRTMAWLELAVALAGAGLAGGLALLLARPTPTSSLEHILLLGMNLLAGALVGLEFPLANHILQEGRQEGSRIAGSLYAWDLLGAMLGAVVVSAVLLPALGPVQTALLVALVKGGSLILLGTVGSTLGSARRGR